MLFHFVKYAPLAQLVEQLTLNQWVLGSSPWRCTKFNPVYFARDFLLYVSATARLDSVGLLLLIISAGAGSRRWRRWGRQNFSDRQQILHIYVYQRLTVLFLRRTFYVLQSFLLLLTIRQNQRCCCVSCRERVKRLWEQVILCRTFRSQEAEWLDLQR